MHRIGVAGARHGVLAAVLLCAACDSRPASTTAPTLPNPTTGAFVAFASVNPIYIGYGSKVTPESPVQAVFSWGVTIQTTGSLRGTIQRVDAKLSDRSTGMPLGMSTHVGPFLNVRDGRIPNQIVDPLLETGQQTFNAYQEELGFVGSPALLSVEVTIRDVTGKNWISTATTFCELFPKPVVRSPVNITVRQNDPGSGCTFDPVNGFGLVLDIRWDPPPAGPPVDDYGVAVADGSGTEIMAPFYAHTRLTSLRFVRCDTHVPVRAEHAARVGVIAGNQASGQLSGFGVGRFDFQSCREAGTPACQ
jgi:hypothetical protein